VDQAVSAFEAEQVSAAEAYDAIVIGSGQAGTCLLPPWARAGSKWHSSSASGSAGPASIGVAPRRRR
jgi:hypothetical protein